MKLEPVDAAIQESDGHQTEEKTAVELHLEQERRQIHHQTVPNDCEDILATFIELFILHK